LAEALAAFRDGLAIARRLAAADPGNAGWQRDLSQSHAWLAFAFRKAGDVEQAGKHLGAGRAIIAPLVEAHPDWTEWREDLAWFDAQLAELGAKTP
ncbi:MAG TPA: hypothetical protein VME92_17940, partial [Acetobacteraceae bacterium]|nr:hypothetical protein [Acetobacteraceae bacterium]